MPEVVPRILLVDDDQAVIDSLSLILEANGFRCRTATNGFEALKDLRLTLPDIMISDLRMPQMSGYELLPIVRRRYPQLPIIVMSAESMGTVQSMGLPMDAYLQKGAYASKQLIATIREFSAGPHLREEHSSDANGQCSTDRKG